MLWGYRPSVVGTSKIVTAMQLSVLLKKDKGKRMLTENKLNILLLLLSGRETAPHTNKGMPPERRNQARINIVH